MSHAFGVMVHRNAFSPLLSVCVCEVGTHHPYQRSLLLGLHFLFFCSFFRLFHHLFHEASASCFFPLLLFPFLAVLLTFIPVFDGAVRRHPVSLMLQWIW